MSIAHKHCELIKAWADGADIEYLSNHRWLPTPHPAWETVVVYRVKPAEPSKLEALRQEWTTAFEAYWAELEKEAI